MANAGSLLVSREIRLHNSRGCCNTYNNVMRKSRIHIVTINLTSHGLKQNPWTLQLLRRVPVPVVPASSKCNIFLCQSFMVPRGGNETSILKSATLILTRTYDALCGSLLIIKLFPAIGLIAFAVWGVQPLIRLGRNLILHKTDDSWKKSNVFYVTTHYIRPLLLWFGATLICRSLDPLVLSSDVYQAIKQRLLNFVQSLSTVVALAYCLSSLIEQAQKFFIETNDSGEARNMGFDFAGKTVYTAVWVAALSLFMELLGFSTQKWLTAGGLGTVLLTLAGREILTNFLSSIMIHATRPFVLNEWIQTKIDGYEVSGTVEHVGWWSPTIIRGDDREAVHIPNHKFTVNVVRNLSQKTHWRIKSHLAISHFDVNKINLVVADMRKVLAKNPQIEQQRLHRRVFLDYIDPENQALMVLVSCFVKTSHFEEYLCVKEAILLDFLRVISHHRARLATPIRTVQKSYREADLDLSFADTIISQSTAADDRPLLLIEPSYKMSSDDKVKASTRSTSRDEEKEAEPEAAYIADMHASNIAGSSSDHEADKSEEKSSETQTQNPRPDTAERIPEMPASKNEEREKKDESMVIKSISTTPNRGTSGKSWAAMPASDSDEMASISLRKKEDGEKGTVSTAISLPPLEENILLGLALEGSKRTLPQCLNQEKHQPIELHFPKVARRLKMLRYRRFLARPEMLNLTGSRPTAAFIKSMHMSPLKYSENAMQLSFRACICIQWSINKISPHRR